MAEATSLDRIEDRPGAAELRAESYHLLGLSAGSTCVDVGCGAGQAVAELTAARVNVIGVDIDAGAVAAARSRMPDASFEVARADRLPLEDGTVDGYRAAGLLHLVEDPRPILSEAWRVLRPGGRIVLAGQDYRFLLLDSSDQDLTDVVLLGLESHWTSPRVARSYRGLLLDNGFRDSEVVVHSEVITDHRMLGAQLELAAAAAVDAALITRADADEWLDEQADRGRRDRFLAVRPTILAAATR